MKTLTRILAASHDVLHRKANGDFSWRLLRSCIRAASFVAVMSVALLACQPASPLPNFKDDPTLSTNRSLLPAPGITNIRVLSQNWKKEEARWFYNTAQGSRILPYKWFLNLEQDDSTNLFRSAANMQSFGYLARSPDAHGNPDGLPVGFAQDGEFLGLTCAACHTGQINYQNTAWLIDGAPTLGDGEVLLRKLENALKATQNDPQKLDRFVTAVLGNGYSAKDRKALENQLAAVVSQRSGYNDRDLPHSATARFGPGRIDAFGGILNEVAVRFAQVPTNETKVDAPVSYPFLWDTPQHDFVQWNGIAENTESKLAEVLFGTSHIGALGRNVGEVMGVFGDINTTNDPGLTGGYPSSVNQTNLIALEELLRKLWSPLWPEDAFGKINADLKAKGALLYNENCIMCHALRNRTATDQPVKAVMSDVRTDETMAKNVAVREGSSGVLTGRRFLLPLFQEVEAHEPLKDLLSHIGQRVIVGPRLIDANSEVPAPYSVKATVYMKNGKILDGSFSRLKFRDGKLLEGKAKAVVEKETGQLFEAPLKSGRAPFSPMQMLDVHKDLATLVNTNAQYDFATNSAGGSPVSQISYKYKARPLNGIWATAPYLHNGSVPNLEELLKPAQERMKSFRIGSREFDAQNVGYRTDMGDFQFDTTAMPGNSNAGHDFVSEVYKKEFSPDERRQLIEYLKSL